MDIVSFLQFTFIQRALVAGIFIAVLCAILGMFLVLRRMSLIGDGLAHVTFGAIALGLFFGMYPFAVAVPLVVAGSYLILKISEKAKVYGDAAIGIVSAVGIAGGILLASLSGGFNVDLFSYLFGNILAISSTEVALSIVLSITVLGAIYLFYQEIFAAAFDEEFARVSGLRTSRINTLLVSLTAVSVVLSVRVVGIMLISALLILPAVTALQHARSLARALLAAAGYAVLSVLLGIALSFYADLPTGATIVMANAAFFGTALLYKRFAGS
ncbi:MAG: metal ABC transporter permease [Desulfobacterota bacterium]|nr:metal ABC transporter permease [Thermodesulfobacteriota bacterium]